MSPQLCAANETSGKGEPQRIKIRNTQEAARAVTEMYNGVHANQEVELLIWPKESEIHDVQAYEPP